MTMLHRPARLMLATLCTPFLVVPALGAVSGSAHAAAPVYPNLRMARLANFSIGSDPSLPGHRLLRFDATIVNVAAAGGTFEVLGQRPDTSTTTMAVSQLVHNDDGSTTTVPTSAQMIYDTGDGHHHWHVVGLEAYTLTTPSGALVTSPKVGFCFYDSVAFNLSLPGAPQTPVYTGCGTQTSLTVDTGLSVGWGDRYPSTAHNQWVDITGQPYGQYHLQAVADPRDYFQETAADDNSTWVDLSIHGNSVKVLRYGPSA
jgi:Lysyl oxidase